MSFRKCVGTLGGHRGLGGHLYEVLKVYGTLEGHRGFVYMSFGKCMGP